MKTKLKRILFEREIPQAEIARAVGVTEAYVSYIVNGIKKPTADTLKRIADFLSVSEEELKG